MLKILIAVCLVLNLKTITAKYDNFVQDQENDLFSKTNFVEYVGDVIVTHEDSEIIFHFDNTNWNLVGKIMTNVNSRIIKSVNLICYKADIEKNLFERPLVKKILNVVILQNMQLFSLFLNSPENVNDQDEAIFVFSRMNSNFTYLKSEYKVKLFGKVLLLYLNSNLDVVVNSMCYFCGKSSKRLVEIFSSNNDSAKSKFTFDKKTFDDFQKHLFKVAFTEYYPFIWCEEMDEKIIENHTASVCNKPKGSELDLITMMARRLNFKFVLIIYSEYGQMIKDLIDTKIDFVFGGITATSERAEKSTFSRQYWFEGYYFLYVYDSNMKQELGRVLHPFEGSLWLLLATLVFITSIVLYALDRVESYNMVSISCSDSLWVCIYMAIEQNVNIKQVFRVRTGPAVLLMAWILFCLNLSTAYKSKLSAIVMNPPHKEPSNIEELINCGYKFIVNERYKDVFLALMVNTTDPVVQKAQVLTETRNGLCEEFLYAVEERAAILDEYTSLQYELRHTCKGELNAKRVDTEGPDGTKLRIAKVSLRVIGQVWLLQKRIPYRMAFDKVLGETVEVGLVEMWRRYHTKGMARHAFPESHNSNTMHYHTPLSLRLLLSLFLLYALGNGFAIIVFVFERFCYNKSLEPFLRRISFSNN